MGVTLQCKECRSCPWSSLPASARSRRCGSSRASRMQGYLMRCPRHPRSTLFLSRRFSRVTSASASLSWLTSARSVLTSSRHHLTSGVAGKPLLAGSRNSLDERRRFLGDALLAAELGDASSPRKPSSTMRIFSSAENCRLVALRDVPDCLLRTLRSLLVSLSHRVPPRGYDEPQTLSYAISSNCTVGPDGKQPEDEVRPDQGQPDQYFFDLFFHEKWEYAPFKQPG